MSNVSGGLGQLFDSVRQHIEGDEGFRGILGVDETLEALDRIEEAFLRRVRWLNDARGLCQRLQGLVEKHIKWLRLHLDLAPSEMAEAGDELETQLLTELGAHSLDKMPPKALVELGIAVAAELERRGITAFPVQLGGDGKIQGPGAPQEED